MRCGLAQWIPRSTSSRGKCVLSRKSISLWANRCATKSCRTTKMQALWLASHWTTTSSACYPLRGTTFTQTNNIGHGKQNTASEVSHNVGCACEPPSSHSINRQTLNPAIVAPLPAVLHGGTEAATREAARSRQEEIAGDWSASLFFSLSLALFTIDYPLFDKRCLFKQQT